jgi:hypothetical protein
MPPGTLTEAAFVYICSAVGGRRFSSEASEAAAMRVATESSSSLVCEPSTHNAHDEPYADADDRKPGGDRHRICHVLS